jgi:hypothetical protein
VTLGPGHLYVVMQPSTHSAGLLGRGISPHRTYKLETHARTHADIHGQVNTSPGSDRGLNCSRTRSVGRHRRPCPRHSNMQKAHTAVRSALTRLALRDAPQSLSETQ